MLETIKKRNKDHIEGYLEHHIKAEKERIQREELAWKLLEEDKRFVEERWRKEEELKMNIKLKATADKFEKEKKKQERMEKEEQARKDWLDE